VDVPDGSMQPCEKTLVIPRANNANRLKMIFFIDLFSGVNINEKEIKSTVSKRNCLQPEGNFV
jgi:hypothetical protein